MKTGRLFNDDNGAVERCWSLGYGGDSSQKFRKEDTANKANKRRSVHHDKKSVQARTTNIELFL
jgi:hypothetical protein